MSAAAELESTEPAQPDSDDAIAFLRNMQPDGPWVLTVIEPAGPSIETRTFLRDAQNERAARDWVERFNGRWNVYWQPNPPLGALTKKSSKQDIREVRFLYVDCDPRSGESLSEEQTRIRNLFGNNMPQGVPPPTALIFSGNGMQALWRLENPIPINGNLALAEDAEKYNSWLAVLFGADHCGNVDRILRLPFTWNIPTKTKKAMGRVPALAYVVECDPARVYSESAFKKAPPKMGAAPHGAGGAANPSSGPLPRVELGDLPPGVSQRTKAVIVTGTDPVEPERYPTRSEALWGVVCELIRAGCSDETIAAIILDPDFGISAHVRDQKSPRKYAARQIAKAKAMAMAKSNTSPLDFLNERHAVLLQEGGKTRVLSWERSELDDGRVVPVLQSFDDFRNRYMNRFVEIQTEDGAIRIPWGKWWLSHSQRREYLGLRFMPGAPEEVALGPAGDKYLNLWRGFSVKPIPGDWSLIKAHIDGILANGDPDAASYIIKWAAYAVQHPDEPAEVALVLKGNKGCGKGLFGRTMRRLIGQHGLHITSPSHLTGRFNSHLRDCCLLFADEAIVPGDPEAESVLKGLITEPELAIEGKGVNLVQARNRLHVIMASNHAWVVPATIDERRFAIFDVPDTHIGERTYFDPLFHQLENGGPAAMLHDLMHMDLGDWHPRENIPRNDARNKQIAASFKGMDKVMLDLLRVGEIPVEEWVTAYQPFVATSVLRDYVQRISGRSDITLNAVASLLTLLGAEKDRNKRPSGYILLPLADTRRRWNEKKVPCQWADTLDDWEAIPGGSGTVALREWEKNGEPRPRNDGVPF